MTLRPEAPLSNRSSAARLLRSVWISPDGRLRAGWRLLIHGALLLVFALMLLLPLSVLLVARQGLEAFGRFDSLEVLLPSSAAMTLATLAATGLARRLLDRRSFRSLGLWPQPSALADFLAGFAIAFVMMATVLLLHLAGGWLVLESWGIEQLRSDGAPRGLALSLVLYLLVGVQEELLFRGYQLQNLIDGTRLPLGIALSSFLFGASHLRNPAASWPALLGITLAGLLLSWAWFRTHSLWLPIGLHTGWNFFEGTVFGFPVSGLDGFHLVRHRVAGPPLLTGGAFGPEAGLLLLPGLLLAAYLVLLYSRRRRPTSSP